LAEYEYRALDLPPRAGRDHVREVLTIHAQYGDGELATHRIWPDGRRRVTVRRRLRPGVPPAPLPS
jgi:hypothetical protein